jgi:hypothetical protein
MRWIAALMLSVLSIASATAEAMKADGVGVTLELPAGFCALSRAHPVDKLIYEQQERLQAVNNEVMLSAVPCDELAALRSGKTTSTWALWLLNGKPGSPTRIPAGMARTAVSDELAKALPSLDIAKISADVDARARKEGVGVNIASNGVIHRDDLALYTGMLAGTQRDGKPRQVAAVTGWIVLSGRLFTYNVYGDYEGRQSFDKLLAGTKDVMARSARATDATIDTSLPPGMTPVKPKPPIPRL